MYILFDIGGTKTRVASALTLDNFNSPKVFETNSDYSQGLSMLKQVILEESNGRSITTIVGGIAGPWDKENGKLLSSKNLPNWVGKDLQRDLEEAFHTKVMIDNDSSMVGLGEAIFGAGKGYSIVAYITVSTGVGGVRIVNGQIDEHSVGFEPGKQIMNENGDNLESLISGKSLEEKTGMKPNTIIDHSVWDSLAKTLAFGLNNIIVNWSPDVVVLGGSMMNNVGISIDSTEKYLKEVLTVFPTIPPLKKSTLGDIGGLYGGLAYLKMNTK
jgi:predicted NBD/HSP70 family sugar kinase